MKYFHYPTFFITKSIYKLYNWKIFKLILIYILMINSKVLKITLIPANIEENILQVKPIQICELIVYYYFFYLFIFFYYLFFFIIYLLLSPASIVVSLVISRIVCIGTYSILCDFGAYTSSYAYTRI